jgi:hypothetical protein
MFTKILVTIIVSSIITVGGINYFLFDCNRNTNDCFLINEIWR